MLHAGDRVLGQLLAGPQRGAGPGVPGRDHPAHHVHPTGQQSTVQYTTVHSASQWSTLNSLLLVE